MLTQYAIHLQAKPRGFHLVTEEILSALPKLPKVGILNLFLQHTSAALSINENADPSVREDFELYYNKIVPEELQGITHTYEGPDDMPAHIKSSITGVSITIPISNGKLNLGIWQGIYLCEFRNRASGRRILASIYS